MNTFQHWLQEPSVSSQFTIVQATQAFNQSFLQLNSQFINYSLLANGGPPEAPASTYPAKQHPVALNLSWTSFNHQIAHLPLYERLSFGAGYQHNSYGLQYLGGEYYPTIWQHDVDFQMFVPSLKLGGNPIVTKNYYLNASTDLNRTWNSAPHYIDTANTSVSLSKQFDAHFLSYLSYSVLDTGDYYGSQQSAVYPPIVPIVNGVPYPGYAAFNGFATLRTLSLDVGYTNAGNFSAYILARQHRDFPEAIPNYLTAPITNVLGQEIQPSSYIGEPPYDISADVRARVNDHTSIDVSRGYYFNFGNRGWTPQFVIQVTQ